MGWKGWTVVGLIGLGIAGGATENDDDKKAAAPAKKPPSAVKANSTTSPAPAPAKAKSSRQRLYDELASGAEAKIGTRFITVTLETPVGGFDGASTGDLNREAADAFKAIYSAGYSRASRVIFEGGLVDTKTGRDLDDARTGLFEMSREDANAIDWSDEEIAFKVDFANFRVFAHPALKLDD